MIFQLVSNRDLFVSHIIGPPKEQTLSGVGDGWGNEAP